MTVSDTLDQSSRMINKKLKAGIFVGPQARKLINGYICPMSMNEKEFSAWKAFVEVVKTSSSKVGASRKIIAEISCLAVPGGTQ